MGRQLSSWENLLINIEQGPWNAFYRIVIGVFLNEIYFLLFGANGSPLALPLLLVLMLIILRLGPAVLRRLLPFSIEARAIWMRRRRLAKLYDSYQWRKLFWIGFGFALDAALSSRYQGISIVLASACMITGAGGLFVWRYRCMTERTIRPLSPD